MKKLVPVVVSCGLTLLLSTIAQAGSATWDLNPSSSDWNTAANWTPMTVPNGPADVATFGVSNKTGVSISANTEVSGITFTPAASGYTITINGSALTFSGSGITGNSGFFEFTGSSNLTGIVFSNSSTAGNAGFFKGDGVITFQDNASAGNAHIDNYDGATRFSDSSTAANLSIFNDAGLSFTNNSTAANASIENGPSGGTFFSGTSSAGNSGIFGDDTSRIGFAGNATAANAGIDVAGGSITFADSSQGGTAGIFLTVKHEFEGTLDISGHNAPGVTIGSLGGLGSPEGNPRVFLGANKLTVGGGNFPGVIEDNGTGGSLAKIGTGTLELTGASSYTGGTTVSNGTLLINNMSGSGTGTGAVQVSGGTLGGNGTIAGSVTVGTGSSGGASISPGASPGTLTIQSALTLNSDATYQFELNSTTAVADKIVANGVTLNGPAFLFTDLGLGKLAPGTAFVIIDNTSNSAISGVFSNLADNSEFSNNGNTYQVSYEGGTGNDLTLTVVPEPSTWAMLLFGLTMLAALRPRKQSRETVLNRDC